MDYSDIILFVSIQPKDHCGIWTNYVAWNISLKPTDGNFPSCTCRAMLSSHNPPLSLLSFLTFHFPMSGFFFSPVFPYHWYLFFSCIPFPFFVPHLYFSRTFSLPLDSDYRSRIETSEEEYRMTHMSRLSSIHSKHSPHQIDKDQTTTFPCTHPFVVSFISHKQNEISMGYHQTLQDSIPNEHFPTAKKRKKEKRKTNERRCGCSIFQSPVAIRVNSKTWSREEHTRRDGDIPLLRLEDIFLREWDLFLSHDHETLHHIIIIIPIT